MVTRRWARVCVLLGPLMVAAPGAVHAAAVTPLNFGAATNISETAGRSANPRLLLNADGALLALWREGTVLDAYVALRRSIDGGSTFQPLQHVSSTPGPTYSPAITGDPAGDLFVVWREPLFPDADIFFSRSLDHGLSFSPGQDISNSPGSSAAAEVAADRGGAVYVAWDDNDQIAFSRSLDRGATFSDPIGFTVEGGLAGDASVAARRSGEVVVAWTELVDEFFQVMYTRTLDGGTTFSEPRNLSQSTEDATTPIVRIAPDGSLLAVYGQRDEEGNLLVAFRRSIETVSRRPHISRSLFRLLGFGAEPAFLAGDDGRLYVAWRDDDGELFFTYSPDGGANWSAPVNLSNSPGPPLPNFPGYSSNPTIALTSRGEVLVAWQEVLPDLNQEILVRRASR